MKYIGLLSSAASGKLGGIVASHNRNGSYLRKHVIPVQPRTAAQSAGRNQLAGFSAAFKALTAAQIAGWNALGNTVTLKSKLGTTYNPTGQQLFVSCNRHLASIGITTLLTTAPTIPSVPAITSLSVGATLTGGILTAFPAILGNTPSSSWGILIRATSVQTTGRSFVGKSAFRTLAGYENAALAPTDYFALYLAKFGPLPQAGIITFELKVVDPVSGFAGPAIRASVQFAQVETGALFTLAGASLAASLSEGTPVAKLLSATYAAIAPFAGAPNWTLSNLPAGVSAAFTGGGYTGSGSGGGADAALPTINVVASSGSTIGTYTADLTASFGSFAVTTPFTVTIVA
jgi:hypothetical protein